MQPSEAFDAYYRSLYQERWDDLRHALLQPKRHIARITSVGAGSNSTDLPELHPGCLDPEHPEVQSLIQEREGHYYVMDLASVLAARSLAVEPGMQVWDACAAPGGKTLILLEALKGEGSLCACDLSRPRCARLKQVVTTHAVENIAAPLKTISCDSVNWGFRHQNTYDAVMLDAPCSSERHVITDETHLNRWSEKRVKTLVKRQYALLCSAVLACKPGGRIAYSTCSINPGENDGIIDRYLQKKPGTIRCMTPSAPLGRASTHGWSITPDLDDGWGPLYFVVLEKLL